MIKKPLPRVILDVPKMCYKCKEIVPSGIIIVVYDKKYYCECCVEDYEQEGRPIDD